MATVSEFGSTPLSRWQKFLNSINLGSKAKIQFISTPNSFYADVKNRTIYISTQVAKPGKEHILMGAIFHEAGHINFTPIKAKIRDELFIVFNCFEDIRIENVMEKRFRCRDKFDALYEYALSESKFNQTWFDLLRYIIVSVRGYSFEVNEDAREFLGKKRQQYADFFVVPESVQHAYDLTNKFYEKIKKDHDFSNQISSLKEDAFDMKKAKKELSEIKKEIRKAVSKVNSFGRKINSLNKRKKQTPAVALQRADATKDKERAEKELSDLEAKREKILNKIEKKKEFKDLHRKYHEYLEKLIGKILHDRVEDEDEDRNFVIHIPEPEAKMIVKQVEAKTPPESFHKEINQVKRALLPYLKIKKRKYFERGLKRGKLDRNRLWKQTDAVFKKSYERTKKDIAISLLIDCSGSMDGAKLEEAKKVAYVFAEAIKGANVSFEVLGFSTKSDERNFTARKPFNRSETEALYHLVCKSFSDEATTSIWGLETVASNCDPESIVWAGKRLLKRPEKKKILIVFSDGMPAIVTANNHHALHDSVLYFGNQLSKLGVEVVGVGINSNSQKKYYKKFIEIDRLEDLMVDTVEQIKKLIRG